MRATEPALTLDAGEGSGVRKYILSDLNPW